MTPIISIQHTLDQFSKTDGVNASIRLNNGELKTGLPKGNWLNSLVCCSNPERSESEYIQQKQAAVDFMNQRSEIKLEAREITVGQAQLQLNPPKSDEEFIQSLAEGRFNIGTAAGRKLFTHYLEQKLASESQTPTDMLGEIDKLINNIDRKDLPAIDLASQWLTEKIVEHLAKKSDYQDSLNVHLYESGDSDFLPEYFNSVKMVDRLSSSQLNTLKEILEKKGQSTSDPIYRQVLFRLSKPEEQMELKSKMIDERNKDLENLTIKLEETRQRLSQRQQSVDNYEKEMETMSPADITEALWVGYVRINIEELKNKISMLDRWIGCINNQLEWLASSSS
ncbi:hypothetical protein [Endozoicomonas sp. YOMI1]|uniref:hypothetical protein n=1 Tax=Endozoicomonas sp. YOMI1 TaxID=2828739 RepID=UPI00214744D6|nr:hypothetical protein [Endozoicomonas sp. YOMI1]